MTAQNISLYFSEGSSDKEYHAELVPQGEGYLVNFRYGRRGSTLTPGTKTASPQPYETAKVVYDKLVGEKLKKGYSPGETGAAYQATNLEERFTGVVPQLLNAIDESELPRYFADIEFVAQEKHDGQRVLVRRTGQKIEGINRRGLLIALPKAVESEALLIKAENVLLDGELIGEVFIAFDILELEKSDLRSQGYGDRLAKLEVLFKDSSSRTMRAVVTARTAESKAALFSTVRAANGEGIVVKDIKAPYSAGRPASGGPQLKFKFTASATCRVAKRNGTKRSVSLELLDGSKWIGVGNVTVPANAEVPKAGQLCEIVYLYAYPNGGSLFQPVYRGTRDDVAEEAATVKQLKYKPESSEDDDG